MNGNGIVKMKKKENNLSMKTKIGHKSQNEWKWEQLIYDNDNDDDDWWHPS